MEEYWFDWEMNNFEKFVDWAAMESSQPSTHTIGRKEEFFVWFKLFLFYKYQI